MSLYGKFIEEVLEKEYNLIKLFKSDDMSDIRLFRHNETQNNLVRIHSKNRNDHVYRNLRGMRHSNLPVIYDACSCEEHLCVLESYVEGVPLSELMNKSTITPENTINYVMDVCTALAFLHKNKIIHRDVKPANIIITPDNRAVLIDLSAARSLSDEQSKDTVNLGTVGYAAPEQFGVTQSLPPTDIYAVGVLLNQLMLGEHPSVKTPSGKAGRIIRKCTDTQISKRYQTISSLMSDLKSFKRLYV